MAEPLVSVHLLTYNHVKFIRQSVESVLAQKTTFPFEVIIGDDCSTDGTSAIVDEYAARYPHLVRVVRGEKNGGPQPNSIRILENCRGKYMAALEGDDYWTDPYKLQKQADFMEAHPDFSICFTNTRVEFFDGDGEPYLLNQNLEKDVFELKDLIGEKEIWFMGTATLFYTMSSIFPVQPWFPKTKSGDIPMIMLAARHGKIKFLPDVTAAYRRHAAGASNTDHKDDAVFLENRIMMYSNLNRDTGYQFNYLFKRNLGGWYYLLLNSRQLKDKYFKRLGVAYQYINLMYPDIPHLKEVIRDHIVPAWVMDASRWVRWKLGLIRKED
ncbi:MAG: glycosyltransferase [Leadbetterella sp.]|nr:glycosyltransferase [Leadbetterella sp.]